MSRSLSGKRFRRDQQTADAQILRRPTTRHSRIRFVTPAQRHRGADQAILAQRVAVYQAAQATHPESWAKNTRNWSPIEVVMLNPERPETKYKKVA